MMTRTAFEIDCNPVIPECGFACPQCIEEIKTTLASKDGVTNVTMGKGAQEGKVIVEHDPAVVTVDQLLEVLKALPSFYEGFFIPLQFRHNPRARQPLHFSACHPSWRRFIPGDGFDVWLL